MNQIKTPFMPQIKRPIIILLFIVVYFLLLQSINSPIYLKYQNESEMIFYLEILNFVMVFSPFIILFCKNGIKKNLIMFQCMLKKYWIQYFFYVFSIYLIRQQVVLGVYYIDMGIGGLVFWLTKSPTSEFIMVYVFGIFQSFISLLFFIILPFYTLVLHSYIFRLKKDNA